MANKFKSGFGDSSYRQIIPHDFSKTNKLKTANQKDQSDLAATNKLLAERNRESVNSLSRAQQAEIQGEEIILDYDTKLREGMITEENRRLKESYTASIKQIEQRTNWSKREDQAIANIVQTTIGTTTDILQRIDKAAEKRETADAFSASLAVGNSPKTLSYIRTLTREVYEDVNNEHETNVELRALGLEWNDIKALSSDGVRQGVFNMAMSNSVRAAIPGYTAIMLQKDEVVPGTGQKFSELMVTDPVGAKTYWNRKASEMLGIHIKDLDHKAFIETFNKAQAAAFSQIDKISNKHSELELQKDRDVASFSQLTTARESGDYSHLSESLSINPAIRVPEFLSSLERLAASDQLSGAQINAALREINNPATGISLIDSTRYHSEVASILDTVRDRNKKIHNGNIIASKGMEDKTAALINSFKTGDLNMTPQQIEELTSEINKSSSYTQTQKDRLLKQLGAAVDATSVETTIGQNFKDKLTAGQNSGFGPRDNPNTGDPEEDLRLMRMRDGFFSRNVRRTNSRAQMTKELRARTKVNIKSQDDVLNFEAAESHAHNTWDETVQSQLDADKTLEEAYNIADAEFWKQFGEDKFSGIYGINNAVDNPDGGSRFKEHGISKVEVTPAVHNSSTNRATEHLTTRLGKRGTNGQRLEFATTNASYLESVGLDRAALERFSSGTATTGDWGALYHTKNATGYTHMTDTDFLNRITTAQGVGIEQTSTRTANSEEYNNLMKLYKNPGALEAPMMGQPGVNTGIIVTSAHDSSGEPGSDFVIEGGRRGAKFKFPYPARVVRIERNSNLETHLEHNPNGERGPGNFIELRTELPTGISEVRIAHCDTIANVQVGQELPAGSFVCTQGRTGSTLGDGLGSGAHMSLDWYKPGTTTPDWASADWFLNNYLRGNQPQQTSTEPPVQPAVQPVAQPEPATNATEKVTNSKEIIPEQLKVGISSTTGEKVVMYWNDEEMNWKIKPWNEVAANVKENNPSLYKQLEEYNQ